MMESDDTLVDVVSHDETLRSDSMVTASHDESEEVDILSDFGPSDTNTFQSDETFTYTKLNDTTDEGEHTGFLSTFAGDHNYCCTSLPTDNEETESENETRQSKPEIVQSGHESSPKVIIESQLVGEKEVLYCVCRRPDVDQFMIGCDACDEWYHGSCIGITKKDAKKIKQFFCHSCQEKNPDLKTKFKISKEKGNESYQETDETDDNRKAKQRNSRRCGQCTACQIQEDCGKCDYCQDMRKFGGPNKKRQKCRLRQCLNKSVHLNIHDGSSKYEEPRRKIKKIRQPRRHEDFGGSSKKKHAIKLKHTRHLQGKEQKLKRQLSEKDQRRRKRLASREKSGLYSERTRQTVEVPRQCYGPQCQRRARSNSKYCSHECGIQVAVRRIQEILPGRVKEWNETSCIANSRAEEKLARLKNIQESTRARLLELDQQSKELDEIIERSSHLTAVNEEDTESEQDTDIDLNVHCVTCGIALMPKVALRHMEKCYMKNESFTSFGSNFKSVGNLFCDFYNSQQKTYCKRLRVLCPEHTKEPKVSQREVCGCPLTNDQLEETKDLCCIAKRHCVRHYCWEKLRRAQIDGERVRQWLKLEEVYEQEKQTRMAMTQRGGVLGLLLHRTIVES
ncbi:CXXC-type zinc finger protein 1-like isoform X2 [Dendronephthya gigantea]|uniref:CXXC-type zinc finger protein 1-like isoform X2 n=1 Tax=Dendronephthya gigantea TaxID=151771 RepID=UPI00106977F0|nr:CXXC-type zinc finger protein 1-like isoform X2 [Dendronephthya gigantea]